MLGAIIGDIVGSAYEFHNVKEKDFDLWPKDAKITDNTVCTLAVADMILHTKEPAKTLQEWCRRYPVGYGKKFQEWIDSDNPKPYGSWGNGAVMRISPVGFYFNAPDKALEKALSITEVTHNHPLSLKAVAAYLQAMSLMKQGKNPQEIKDLVQHYYGYEMNRSVDEIRAHYNKFYVGCEKTVPEAMICALDATSFEDALRNAVSLASMAGALAELRFGVPQEMKQKALGYLDSPMKILVNKFYTMKNYVNSPAPQKRYVSRPENFERV